MIFVRSYSKVTKGLYSNSTIKIFRNSKPPRSYKRTTQKDGIIVNSLAMKDTVPKTIVSANATENSERIPPREQCPDCMTNTVNIQMLPSNLHAQLFPQYNRDHSPANHMHCTKMKQDLQRHGIDIYSTEKLPNLDLKLPPLKGKNIEEHFWIIGEQQVRPYKALLNSLLELDKPPKKPKEWIFQPGWTIYDSDTGASKSIDYPLEDGLVLDVEVCVADGPLPVMATAFSHKHWYSWVSSRLASENPEIYVKQKIPHYISEDLIPLGQRGMSPKLVVGHNVSYDRARLKEEYFLQDSLNRFLDTMSLHVCVSGVTSYQRALMKSKKEPAVEDLEWLSQSSLNSLAEVYRLYCGGEVLEKEERETFVEGTLQDVRNDFQSLMSYCSRDVEATYKILKNLFPLFAERFPHPVTLAGMLEMGSAYLPVNKNWKRYINESDTAHDMVSKEAKQQLAQRAVEACKLLHDDKYKENLWLWDEDWSTPKVRVKKVNPKKPDAELSARRTFMPGFPAWYRKLCKRPPKGKEQDMELNPVPTEISTGMHIAPKLLSLCWEGYPLHYTREHGWGFLVPFTTKCPESGDVIHDPSKPRVPLEKLIEMCPIPEFAQSLRSEHGGDYGISAMSRDLDAKLGRREYYKKLPKTDKTQGVYKGTGVWCNTIIDNCCFFFKLPHKNGKSLRVGNPLSRDFLSKFADNILTSAEVGSNVAQRVVEISRMISYWRNNRDRILGQLVIWYQNGDLPESWGDYEYGAICPQVVTCGTLTRRAMEPTWMTASNSQKERIGSELRAMVQAPPSYRIVGADVDSQELWIASVLGDAFAYGIHGSTPLGWMTLSGTKSNGTDMHSVTAKAVGISRDHAKVINYARIYGAGQNFAEGLLKQFNPILTSTEARSKAVKMFNLTKGKKVYRLTEDCKEEFEDRGYSGYEALKLASTQNKAVNEMFERPRWEGGTESAMFNRLEEIATGQQPVTPFLGCRLSRALESYGAADEGRFLPTRINWVVQSGAVDFLHLMLVSMRWLMGDKARFCLSFHDELRYLVEEKYAYEAAVAMHVTNLLTRCFCASRLGLMDLPMSVAFFSSVEVDRVMRKECTMDCVTPSNPDGLKAGYGIAEGESLTVYNALEKAKTNDLSEWAWIK